ncbi:MAG: RDD family protein [Burkholderiales bacterium]|nr:RDD family protein [Burkholderiales bacterium]
MNTATDDTTIEYAGFWVRVGASLIDTVLMLIVTTPLIVAVYGWDSLFTDALLRGPLDLVISWIFPAAAVILFWIYKQATPGKMALSLRVVDADSGAPLSSISWR